jgi:dihydrofolate reductase
MTAVPTGPRPAVVAIIAAIADNGVIGRDNALPWRLSDDLRRFKALTLGHPVIMGRLTYESMGRPLPERRNLVLSATPGYLAAGATVLPGLSDALAATADADVAFILGGRRLFSAALPIADRLYLTRVHAQVEGDVFFPELAADAWRIEQASHHPADARNEYPYSFEDYVRVSH